ncbi:MAG TPA: alpha/beta hydrolase [Chloroflexia bacterium]|nr:alpha/beta hydrolase [Chloroflexia bacterium]
MTDDTFYESVDFHRVKTSRLSTVYRHSGRDWQDAESIVFIHGSLSSSRWWEPALASFQELMPSKYACYAPDLRSYGDADPLPIRGMDSMSEDVLSVMDSIGIRQAHIVGWSMGGGPATQLVLDHPDRALSLTLVSSVAPSGLPVEQIPAKREVVAQAIHRGDLETLARIVRAGNFREGRFPLNGSPPANALFYYLLQSVLQMQNYPGDENNNEGGTMAMVNFHVAERCAAIRVPVLSLHGDHDAIIPNEYFVKIRQPWPPHLFHEVIFEGAAHTPHVEQPRRFAVALDEFFSNI